MIFHSLMITACIHHYVQGYKLSDFSKSIVLALFTCWNFLKDKLSFTNHLVTSKQLDIKFLILFSSTLFYKLIYSVMSLCPDNL